jgi:serine/threonine protein kinase
MSDSARPRSPSAATPTIGLNDVQLRQVFVDLESEGLRSPKVIARGGTSIVISAFDSALAATVAVKVLFREPSAALAEARLLASVPSHNSIIEIHRMGLLSEGWPYLVLELCPAGSLAGYLRDRGRLSPGLAIAVVRAVAQAVQQLHGLETPVLHLDIKPANLLITRWGGIKLSDFGSSSASGAPRAAAFSPTHAAPEQILGDEVGPFTDLYSIASLLYELIAGVPPYGDLPPEELAEIKVSASSPSLDSPRIPDELRHFLTLYLDRDPRNRRPATASGFERELAAVARRLRVETVPPRLTVLDEADIVDDLTVELSGPMQPISPRVGTQPNWATPPRLGDPGSASPPDRSEPPSETPANDMRRFDPPGRTPPDPSSADDRPPSASTTTDLGHLGGPAHLPVLGIDAAGIATAGNVGRWPWRRSSPWAAPSLSSRTSSVARV